MGRKDERADADAGEYDYVIAGAGSAGCVLANRLFADPKNRVLPLEGGGRDNWIWFHIPVGYLFAIGRAPTDCARLPPNRDCTAVRWPTPAARCWGELRQPLTEFGLAY